MNELNPGDIVAWRNPGRKDAQIFLVELIQPVDGQDAWLVQAFNFQYGDSFEEDEYEFYVNNRNLGKVLFEA